MQHLKIHISGEELHLLAERAIFWPAKAAVLIADVHLGKVSHFRRHGIHLPEQPSIDNFRRLQKVVDHCRPQSVYFLGDLFHSHENRELDALGELMDRNEAVQFHLVLGNHDILPRQRYLELGLHLHPEPYLLEPFYLRHHPLESITAGFHFAGHLHPGVLLHGQGRQRLRLACFFQGNGQMILPAFGEFTGKAILTPVPGDRVYVIAENEVLEVT